LEEITQRERVAADAEHERAEHHGGDPPGPLAPAADPPRFRPPLAFHVSPPCVSKKGTGTVAGTARRVLRTAVPVPFSLTCAPRGASLNPCGTTAARSPSAPASPPGTAR